MFQLADTASFDSVEIEIDGKREFVPDGISVAAALLLLGYIPTRHTPHSGAPRAPYCMIGSCFECLLEIDGSANQRACQQEVCAGMRIRFGGNSDR